MDDIKAVDVMNYPFDPELVKIWWEGSPEMRLMKDTMFKGKIPFIMCSTDEFIAEMDKGICDHAKDVFLSPQGVADQFLSGANP